MSSRFIAITSYHFIVSFWSYIWYMTTYFKMHNKQICTFFFTYYKKNPPCIQCSANGSADLLVKYLKISCYIPDIRSLSHIK